MWDDVLIVYRRLSRNPGSSLSIVLLLAMAIASNACVFAVIYGLLYKELPYPAEQHLATLTSRLTKTDASGWSSTYLDTVAKGTRILDAVLGYRLEELALADDNGRYAGMAKAIKVQPALFGWLGARPALGRLLVADDAVIGAPPSVVIGWELWRSRFGGSRSVLERSLRIDGRDHRVVGVLPEGFGFPQRDRQVWLPLVFTEDERSVANAFAFFPQIGAVGRLQPGRSMSDASTEMMRLARSDPALQRLVETVGLELRAQPLRYLWIADREASLKLMLLAVLLVLAVTVANVCNLYILRLLRRRQELALLEAFGASFARRLRQMLCELALLCIAGGAIGAALTPLGLRLLRHFDILPTGTPQAIGGDGATAVFVVAIVVAMAVAMMLSGLGLLRQKNIYAVLRQTGSGQTASHGAQGRRKALIVGQIALTLPLLFGTTLLLRSSDRLLDQDVGFERTGLLVGTLQPLQSPQAEDLPRQRAALAAWVAAVSSMPGVEAVGLATATPLSDKTFVQPFSPPSTVSLNPRSWPRVYTTYVSAPYFDALGLPIVSGRTFEQGEARVGAPVAIIDADIARKYYGDADPIGKTLSVYDSDTKPRVDLTVVGVVAVARQRELQSKDEFPSLYRPGAVPYRMYDNNPLDEVEVLVRTRGAPTTLVDALQNQLERIAPEMRFVRLITMDQRIADTIKDRRRLNALLRIFGGFAALLTAVGLYTVQAYMVSMRFREFGVRQALGADRRHIIKHVLGQGARLTALGLAIGLPLALALGRMLSAQLYGVSWFDPLSLLAVLALISVIGLAANLGPAYRASKSKPMDALRTD